MARFVHHAVVVPPSLGFGHINPMLELSRRLRPFGFQVSLVVSAASQAKLKPELSGPHDDHIELVTFSDTITIMSSHQPRQPLLDLVKTLQPPATCLISDTFIGWSQDVANSLGIPRVAFWTGSSLANKIFFSIPMLRSQGFIPLKGGPNERSGITSFPGVPFLPVSSLPLVLWHESETVENLNEAMQRSREAVCVLANTIEELEAEVVAEWRTVLKSYLPVGPLVSPRFLQDESDVEATPAKTEHQKQEQHECLEWLDQQPVDSVLYIAFGSEAHLSAHLVEQMVKALRLSKQAFVWAFRGEGFHDELKAQVSGQGLVLDWVPQMEVLKHASVGGFLTHCGWNSALEAICSGVPTLCWPYGAEQNLNSFVMVEIWKTGLYVSKRPAAGGGRDVNADALVDVIGKLMKGEEGKELRKRARQMKPLARGALGSGGSSDRNLKEFVEILNKSSSC